MTTVAVVIVGIALCIAGFVLFVLLMLGAVAVFPTTIVGALVGYGLGGPSGLVAGVLISGAIGMFILARQGN